MKSIKQHRIEYLTGFAFLLCIALLSYVFIVFRVDDMTIDTSFVEDFNSGWKEEDAGKSVSLPYFTDSTDTKEVVIENTIPRAYWGMTMCFYTDHLQMKVYFEDQLKYQFGTKDEKAFGRSSGCAWHFITIPENQKVGHVKVVLQVPYYHYDSKMSPVVIGKKSSCMWNVFQKSVFPLTESIVIFVIAIMLMVLYVWLKFAKADGMGLLPLSLAFFLMAIVCFIDSKSIQFFYGNQYAFGMLKWLALYMLEIPTLLFFRYCYFSEYKRQFNIVALINVVGMLVGCTLQITNILDFPQQKYLLFGLMGIDMIFIIVHIIKYCKKKRPRKQTLVLFVAFFVQTICSFLDYFTRYSGTNESTVFFSRNGFTFLAIVYGVVFARKVGKIFTDGLRRQADFYKKEKESIAKQNELLHIAKEATERANEILDHYNKDLEDKVTMKTDEIMRLQQKVIEGFANLIENRDEFTGQHVKRTSAYVGIIIDGLMENEEYSKELSKEYVDYAMIRRAAPLHDIGKIIVPDAILSKPGKLTKEEFEVIKGHTSASDKIIDECLTGLESTQYIAIAKDMAIYHHEKWDGNGYPEGLSGQQIPLCARIMAVADVFDALISKRSYKDQMTYDEAFTIIEESSGTHFDPTIVDVFLKYRKQVEAVTNTTKGA